MAFSDFLNDNLGLNIGEAGSSNLGISFASTFLLIVVVIALVAGLVYFIMNRRSYNKTIHIFEEVSNQPAPIGLDKAREIVLPHTSTRAFLLRGRGMYLPRPHIQTGKDHYWYFIRDDGEWLNIGLRSLNKELKELNIRYDHTDMRMANASLKKLVEKNYKKLNWIKEYAPYIAIAMLILMLGIVAFLVVGEAGKVSGGTAENVQNLAEITEHMESILASIDNIASSSGVREVT